MANTAHIENIADTFPHVVGWLRCDDSTTTTLTINGPLLTRDPNCYPLMASIKVYEDGHLLHSYITPEIQSTDTLNLSFNEIINHRIIPNGYFEVTVFPTESSRMAHSFFSELWCSVFTKDGQLEFNYPPLNFKGVDVQMLDASYLYYPGVFVDQSFTMALLVANQYDFDHYFDLILYNSSGSQELKRRIHAKRKSVTRIILDEEFEDLEGFFGDGPGMLLAYFPYKMNAFIQSIQRKDGNICGMDHLGYMATYNPGGVTKVIEPQIANLNRINDRLICYCKSVPESHLRALKEKGMDLQSVMSACGAGTVCKGCVVELKNVLCEEL